MFTSHSRIHESFFTSAVRWARPRAGTVRKLNSKNPDVRQDGNAAPRERCNGCLYRVNNRHERTEQR